MEMILQALKGKTVRTKLYEHQREVALHIDTFFTCKIPFMSTISRHIMYRTVMPVPSQLAKDYKSALDKVFRIYRHATFKIMFVSADML
jgi:hypothetical protein